MIGHEDLIWTGNELRFSRRTVAAIEPDYEWPGMWRVRIGGRLTDMVNRTRAKDAARCLVLADLNAPRETQRSVRIRFSERAARVRPWRAPNACTGFANSPTQRSQTVRHLTYAAALGRAGVEHSRRQLMARTGRGHEHMARMRARRRPFSEPRAGRVLSAIKFAFFLSGGEPISTSRLVRSCYPVAHIFGEVKSWHRSNVIRTARRLAEPIGRASTRDRPLLWRPFGK